MVLKPQMMFPICSSNPTRTNFKGKTNKHIGLTESIIFHSLAHTFLWIGLLLTIIVTAWSKQTVSQCLLFVAVDAVRCTNAKIVQLGISFTYLFLSLLTKTSWCTSDASSCRPHTETGVLDLAYRRPSLWNMKCDTLHWTAKVSREGLIRAKHSYQVTFLFSLQDTWG